MHRLEIFSESYLPSSFSLLVFCEVMPDFSQVYSFIGSVFDPGTSGHLQKLKEMDPIDVETVSLLLNLNLIAQACLMSKNKHKLNLLFSVYLENDAIFGVMISLRWK